MRFPVIDAARTERPPLAPALDGPDRGDVVARDAAWAAVPVAPA